MSRTEIPSRAEQRPRGHADVAVGEERDQGARHERDDQPLGAVPDPRALEERHPEQPRLGRRRGREGEVGPEQGPAREEARARTEGHAGERVHRARVAEVAAEADERVGDEDHADRREDERERDGPADQLRGHRAVERHGRGRRHDRDRERDRLPEAQLAAQPFGLLGVARLALRSHRCTSGRSAPLLPSGDGRRNRLGRLAREAVAGAGTTTLARAARPPGARRAPRTSRRARPRAPCGHRELAQPVPERRHRADADARQRRRPARAGRCAAGPRARCAAASGGVPANIGCAAQRSANCSMLALSAKRRALVVGAARRARRRVLDPGRRGDEHQPLDALGRRQRHVQRDPPAHRVAAEGEALGRGGEHVGDAGIEADRRASRAPPWPGRSGASGR